MGSHQNVVIFLQFSKKTKETKGGPQKVVIFLQFSPKNQKKLRFGGRWELSGAHATPRLPSNLWCFLVFWGKLQENHYFLGTVFGFFGFLGKLQENNNVLMALHLVRVLEDHPLD